MKLKSIFENKNFLKLKLTDYSLKESDKIFLKGELNKEKGVLIISPFLEVIESLPEDLLEPILMSGLKYKDTSEPKKWINKLLRLFSPDKIQSELLRIMKKGNDEEKCRAIHLLYYVGYPMLKKKDEEKYIYYGYSYEWNGMKYIQRMKRVEAKKLLTKQKQLLNTRVRTLIKEFELTDNLVLKYLISFHIPHKIEEYPEELTARACNIISEITGEKFPKNSTALKIALRNNAKLEKLLYENLNWDAS